MDILMLLFIVAAIFIVALDKLTRLSRSESKPLSRRDYYRNVYLKSEAWKRKRFVVLRRDNWTCVYCGARATQVHHLRYAKINIGKEPIEWLVSVCRPCHERQHQ